MSKLVGSVRRRASVGTERGAVAIIVALSLVALLIIVALVLDLGDLYKHDRDLQSAADAGALAGAQQIILNASPDASLHADISDMAREYVDNNVELSSVNDVNAWAPQVEPAAVTVELRETGIPFWFANIMPGNSAGGAVKARARAEVKYVTGVRGVAPFAILVMNPEKFRFVFSGGLGHVDITDDDEDGWYGKDPSEVDGGSLTPTSAGTYSVTLQAIGTVDGVETVGLELQDIGVWRAYDTADPAEVLYGASMEQTYGDGQIHVKFSVRPDAVGATATLGKTSISLTRSGSEFSGWVTAPTNPKSNEGYETYDLKVAVTTPKASGNGTETSKPITCGRYIAFNNDVPLKYLMMTPPYPGYSGSRGATTSLGAKIFTRIPRTNDGIEYVLKLDNHGGAGLYSGNWRLADIYKKVNAADEIATMDLSIIDTWELNYPLRIDGPLLPQPGVAAGQVANGLNDRVSNSPASNPDAWRHVVIPVVDYSPDLAGSSQNYTIRFFAEFYILSNPPFHPNDELIGKYVEGPVDVTDWSDDPTGPLYLRTAVLTE